MDKKIAIIGLGYVGLPLAVTFSKQFKTIGFDINQTRIDQLKSGFDKTKEITKEELEASKNITFTSKAESLKEANFYIITVPTPIDEYNTPDLSPIKSASKLVGSLIGKNDIVVYESTVFPGCTEEVCVPILEKISGMIFNKDFFCGYSPERINPGDKVHRLETIIKITSGSTDEIAKVVDDTYGAIITAGTK